MIGQVLNERYRIDAELGRGGMGVVYRAHDTLLERDVAVKVLSGQALGSEGSARLLHEARAAAKLNHPNIVSVYDVGEVDGAPFIVMELVEGTSLHDLNVAGELPSEGLEEILAIARQVSAALEHAHGHGVIHRDIKPENVLLASDGTAKLMDFGLARSVASRLTAEGTIVGTVFYLAPELALGQAFDGRADLYALGVMLYELTTGRLPFTGDDPLAVISQHLHAPVVPPRAKNAAIPPALDGLIVDSLRKEPGDRPASAAEVLEILNAPDILNKEFAPAEELSLLERIERGRLVGRERELQIARGLWKRALAGQGQVLLISGEPGVGKTRLARELVTHAQVTGGRALVGASYAEGGAPYAAFRQIIRQVFRSPTPPASGDGSDGSTSRHRPAFVEGLPAPVLADLMLLAPELRVRYPDLPPNPSLNDPRLEQHRLFENLLVFFTLLSERTPLLLALEDAHWADSGSLSLLRHLARHTRQGRVMLVVTYREVELDQARPLQEVLLDLQRERLATRMKLTRLDREGTEKLLAVLFDEAITPDFLEGIYRETEGNPFFVEEVCKALAESGELSFSDGRWQRPSMAELGIPQSVRVAIQSRVRALPDDAQETLRMAAFLGRDFDWDTLAEASELGEEGLLDALERAERAQLIDEVSREGGGRFAFVHALIPSTLVESTRTLQRRRLHRRAAAALEARQPEDYVALAYHFDRAGEVEQAAGYLLRAGGQARGLYANEEAIDRYRQVLASLAEPPLFQSRREWRLEALQGLGQVYVGIGRLAEAEECLRGAIELGQEMGLAPQELVRLYFWLGEVYWWQSRHDERIRIGEEGLALLAADTESPDALHSAEAAWMNQTIAAGYFEQGDMERTREFTNRTAGFIQCLPYAVELRPAYIHIILACLPDKDVEKAETWLQAFEKRATQHHDLGALAEVHQLRARLWVWKGDSHGAISLFQQAWELFTQIGDIPHQSWPLLALGNALLSLGDLSQAEECAVRARKVAKTVRRRREMGRADYLIGHVCLCQNDWEQALAVFQDAATLSRQANHRLGETEATYRLGQASLARGARETAVRQLQQVLALLVSEGLTGFPFFRQSDAFVPSPPVPVVAGVVSGLEKAHEASESFRALCDRHQAQAGAGPLVQWYLEPAEPRLDSGAGKEHFRNLESQIRNGEWVWQDPFGDCSFSIENGLEIHAANGRNLFLLNWSAPRVLRPASEDWAAQTVCVPVFDDRPTIGGLLLWKNRKNYLRLDRGAAGEREILFSGCLENRDVVIGRGRLQVGKLASEQVSASSARIWLRLERVGDRVGALCSADGEQWFTVGQIEFPVEDPVQVGMHAIGSIDRAIYRGAFPDGTAIRFESFRLWGR